MTARRSKTTPITTPITVPASAPGLSESLSESVGVASPDWVAAPVGFDEAGALNELGGIDERQLESPCKTKNGKDRSLTDVVVFVEVSVLNATIWYSPGGTST